MFIFLEFVGTCVHILNSYNELWATPYGCWRSKFGPLKIEGRATSPAPMSLSESGIIEILNPLEKKTNEWVIINSPR